MLRILIKYLLVFLVVYYFFRIIDKALFGDRRAMEKEKRRKEKEWERFQRQQKRREGSVTIDNSYAPPKKFRNDEGEYVDYEEVK